MMAGRNKIFRGLWVVAALVLAATTLFIMPASASQSTLATLSDDPAVLLANLHWLATGKRDGQPFGQVAPNRNIPAREFSLADFQQSAKSTGIELTMLNCSLDKLQSLNVPSIIQVRVDQKRIRYLLIDRFTGSRIIAFNKSDELTILDRRELAKLYTGCSLVPAESLNMQQPHIWVKEYVIVRDGLVPNSHTTQSFSLCASGATPVKVLATQPCCGVSIDPQGVWEIKRSQPNEVKVTCNVPEGIPSLIWPASLVTDLPRWPIINLLVVGNIELYPRLSPEIVDFGELKRGSCAEKRIKIINVSPQQKVRFLVADNFISIKKQDYDPSSRSLNASVFINTANLRGFTRKKFGIEIKSGEVKKQLEVPVTVTVAGNIALSPDRFIFGIIRKGESPSATIRLLHNAGAGFSIISIKAPTGVLIKWKSIQDGYELEATLDANASFDALQGIVTITTDDSEDKFIDVPINVLMLH